MQNMIKVQLLKKTRDTILCGILAILACNSIHYFEKHNIPDSIYFGCRFILCTNAYCIR
jgi:hypothetical protein